VCVCVCVTLLIVFTLKSPDTLQPGEQEDLAAARRPFQVWRCLAFSPCGVLPQAPLSQICP
jgi:hypothetical protein